MPAIRRKPSEDKASHKRHRKSIKATYAYDFSSESLSSSESEEEYVDLEHLDVASRSESNNDGSTECASVKRRGAANNATVPEPIAISGILLRPTVAFDTFWRFAAERKAIYDRRRAGEPAP
jgi:hypothetical protein